MNKTERFRALVERGYFPRELPPPFHTFDLGKYRESVIKAWGTLGEYPRSTYEVYSIPRIKKVRRNLALVNPVAQLNLSKLISDSWITIRRHLKSSNYSIEVPEIEAGRSRAVARPDFALVALRRTEISADYNHALISDISRFYGTLYTHAVPWALHGKPWCKNNLNSQDYYGKLGTQLDRAVCKGQDNQTIGIPVGPDTSRIISEIVAVSIDHHIQRALKLTRGRAFRHVDDWYIGFDLAGEAEDAIATLATGCRSFELELNADKTQTLEASSSVDPLWSTELREYRFKNRSASQANSLEHYFTKAFHFSRENKDMNVLDYALRRTRSVRIERSNWRIYETFLLKAARSNPTVLRSVVEIMVSYNSDGYSLDMNRIEKLVDDLLHKNAPLGHHAEVAWALFLAKALRLPISVEASKLISTLESSVCGLLALDLAQNNLFRKKLDTSLWRQSMNKQGLLSSMWLLSYEADLKGWLRGATINYVEQDMYFKHLKTRRISFYDDRKNIQHIRRRKPARRSATFIEYVKMRGMVEPVPWELSDIPPQFY